MRVVGVSQRKATSGKSFSRAGAVDMASAALEQLQLQHIRQVLCSFFAYSSCNKKLARIGEYLQAMVRNNKVLEMLFHAGFFLHSVLDYKSMYVYIHFKRLNNLTVLEVLLLLHGRSMVSSQAEQRAMSLKICFMTVNLVGSLVQNVSWAWRKLWHKGCLPLLPEDLAP